MKPSNAYELVQSLSMSEKRQFKVFASRHVLAAESKYIQLFDVLEWMREYDETALKSALAEKGYAIKFLKADQHYLYTLLLTHLGIFHKDKSSNLIVKSIIASIEILFDKGLFRPCLKEIIKGKTIAAGYELYDLLLHLLVWERKTILQIADPGLTVTAVHQQIKSTQHVLGLLNEYMFLHDSAVSFRQEIIKTRSPESFRGLKKLLQHPLLKKVPAAAGVQSKIRFHQIHAMWFYVHKNQEAELTENRKIIGIYNQHQQFREEYPLDYLAIYSRILSITKSFAATQFANELRDFRAFEPPYHSIHYDQVKANIFVQSYMIELSQLLNSKQFATAGKLLPELRAGLKYHKRFISPVATLSLQFISAYTSFSIGDYTGARTAVNDLLNQFDGGIRPDIYNFARLLNLMIHLELRNYSNIKSSYESVDYYFKKNKKLFKTENLILKFFSNPKNYMNYSKKQLLELQEQLEKIKELKIEQFALNYIDFFTWITARLEKIPMAQVKQ